jgi:hypothetical protein
MGLFVEIGEPLNRKQRIEDRERMQTLEELGLKSIRISSGQVMNHVDEI